MAFCVETLCPISASSKKRNFLFFSIYKHFVTFLKLIFSIFFLFTVEYVNHYLNISEDEHQFIFEDVNSDDEDSKPVTRSLNNCEQFSRLNHTSGIENFDDTTDDESVDENDSIGYNNVADESTNAVKVTDVKPKCNEERKLVSDPIPIPDEVVSTKNVGSASNRIKRHRRPRRKKRHDRIGTSMSSSLMASHFSDIYYLSGELLGEGAYASVHECRGLEHDQ